MKNQLIIQKINNEQELEAKVEQRTLELSQINEQLEKTKKILFRDSITDKLSGLYNRRYFDEISSTLFNASMRSKERLSLLMLDIALYTAKKRGRNHVESLL